MITWEHAEKAWSALRNFQVPGVAITLLVLFFTNNLGDGDRAEDRMAKAVAAIHAQQEELNALVDRFTFALATGRAPSADDVQAISTVLVRQYSRIGDLAPSMPAGRGAISEYQVALNDVKKGVQTADTVEDMATLGLSIAKMYQAQKRLEPLLGASPAGPPSSD